MKKVASFSSLLQPNFPAGLQVLLVDGDEAARHKAVAQLEECSYAVTSCSSFPEASSELRKEGAAFDIVLAEAGLLHGDSCPDCKTFVKAVAELPLVLMSASGDSQEVMMGIKLGAADFLEKPLSQLKLRNIWQHAVRKMMAEMDMYEKDSDKSSLSNHASPAASGDEEAGSVGSHNKGCEAETSSNANAQKETEACGESSKQTRTETQDKPVTRLTRAKKGKDGSSGNLLASSSVANRPPLAIKPPGYSMMQGGSWGSPVGPGPAAGCVWGTPMMSPPPPASQGMYAPVPGMVPQSSGWQQPPVSPTAAGSMSNVSSMSNLCALGRQGSLHAEASVSNFGSCASVGSLISFDSNGNASMIHSSSGQNLHILPSVPRPACGATTRGGARRKGYDLSAPLNCSMASVPLMIADDSLGCGRRSADFSGGLIFGQPSLGSTGASLAGSDIIPSQLNLDLGEDAAAPQKAPIGLALRKSASFLDLINNHLSSLR